VHGDHRVLKPAVGSRKASTAPSVQAIFVAAPRVATKRSARSPAASPAPAASSLTSRTRTTSGIVETWRGPGYVVLRQVGDNRWEFVGEADRRPGYPARKARAQAVLDATEGKVKPGEVYAAVPRSEWRVALDL
jgi:hypothetical protein